MIKFLDWIYLKDYTNKLSGILLIHITFFSLIFTSYFHLFHTLSLYKKKYGVMKRI